MAIYQDAKELLDGSVVVALEDGAGNAISSTAGSLNVNVTNSSSGQVADKTAFTYGTSLELTVGAVFQDTSPTVIAGSTNAMRMNAQRGLHVNLRDASGAEIGVAGSAVIVDGSAVTQPVSVAGSVAVTGPLTDTQLRATPVPVSGTVAATQSGTWNINNVSGTVSLPTGAATEASLAAINGKISPASAAITSVARSNVSQTLLASNAARKGFIATNDSGAVAYIAFAASATTSAYTYRLQSNTVVEPNFGSYTGVMSVIWGSAGAGNIVVTELS